MGTNYYLQSNICKHCGRAESERHIGKSSAGWCFSLHVYPADDINDLEDWKPMLLHPDYAIRDEYGNKTSPEDMLSIIENRTGTEDFTKTPFGYQNWTEFHRLNYSEFGPNGLLRHQLDGKRCVKHGSGTWDCLVGEFS